MLAIIWSCVTGYVDNRMQYLSLFLFPLQKDIHLFGHLRLWFSKARHYICLLFDTVVAGLVENCAATINTALI